VNPVLRADVRYRLGSAKALTLHTIFLVIIALLTFLSLPPDLGRLDELRQGGLVLASLIVSAVLTMYFTSACAAGEIGIDGEKSVWDLAASSFPAGTIALGKVLSAASFAALQWLRRIAHGHPARGAGRYCRGHGLWGGGNVLQYCV